MGKDRNHFEMLVRETSFAMDARDRRIADTFWRAALAYARQEGDPQTYGPLKEVGRTERGYTIFREVNEVGGYRYWSDEIGGGVCVWDTCLVDAGTLLECIRIEGASLPSPVTESSGCVTDKAKD